MIYDPQYLVGLQADKEYKDHQQSLIKKVFKENKEVRKQIKLKKSDIKHNYLTITKCSSLGIKKTDMLQWIEEGKLQGISYEGMMYYSREDIAKCM